MNQNMFILLNERNIKYNEITHEYPLTKIWHEIQGRPVLEVIIAFQKAVGFKCLLSHVMY